MFGCLTEYLIYLKVGRVGLLFQNFFCASNSCTNIFWRCPTRQSFFSIYKTFRTYDLTRHLIQHVTGPPSRHLQDIECATNESKFCSLQWKLSVWHRTVWGRRSILQKISKTEQQLQQGHRPCHRPCHRQKHEDTHRNHPGIPYLHFIHPLCCTIARSLIVAIVNKTTRISSLILDLPISF